EDAHAARRQRGDACRVLADELGLRVLDADDLERLARLERRELRAVEEGAALQLRPPLLFPGEVEHVAEVDVRHRAPGSPSGRERRARSAPRGARPPADPPAAGASRAYAKRACRIRWTAWIARSTRPSLIEAVHSSSSAARAPARRT